MPNGLFNRRADSASYQCSGIVKMDFATQIIPAVICLAANLLSGPHSSLRWQTVTAVFGWGAALSLFAVLLLSILWPNSVLKAYALQAASFCLLTALSRDYERLLRPWFPWNR